jgi:dimethylhistidine N-methyltransferase
VKLVETQTKLREDFARDVRAGLCASPKQLHCVYFYDAEGSRLFEEICTLEEYYLTRAEHEILEAHAHAIVGEGPLELIELGSGNAQKTRVLLSAASGPLHYVPIDVSREMLEETSRSLEREYPRLRVTAFAGDYFGGLELPRFDAKARRLVLWLGSNVGNFDRDDAASFLRRVGQFADGIVMGVDVRKSREVLRRAYDDARGVTARFNLNLLARINRELGADFDISHFRHSVTYDEALGRIEMYLVSTRAQRVHIRALELAVELAAGEAIHTENSYKYSPAEIEQLARAAGLRLAQRFYDAAGRFAVVLLSR